MPRWLTRFLMNLVVALGRLEAAILPLSWMHALGRWSASLLYRWVPGIRQALDANARHLLPGELDAARLRRHGVAVLSSFTRFFIELLTGCKELPLQADPRQLISGWDNGERARAAGKGVISVTLHMGNYEMGPTFIPGILGPDRPVAIVYQPDPWGVFEGLRSRQRRRSAIREIPTRSPLFTVDARRVLDAGGVVLAAADIGFPHERGVSYPFMGGRARFLDWPARLACSTGAPLLPGFTYRDASGAYRIDLCEPLFPGAGGHEEMMRRLLAVFATYLERFPEQWLILHPYWEPEEVTDAA